MDKSYLILWEGDIPLSDARIRFDGKYDFQPDPDLKATRKTFWEKEQKKYPFIYDGDILFCTSAELNGETPVFNVGIIKYSYLNLLLRRDIEFAGNKGYLTFRLKLVHKKSNKFVIGQKSPNSQFDPSHYTLPGGLFEQKDVEKPLSVACKREIKEELGITVNQNKLRLRAVNKHRRNNGVILEIEGIIDDKDSTKITPNHEWKDNGLRWVNYKELSQLSYELLHDDIRYFLDQN